MIDPLRRLRIFVAIAGALVARRAVLDGMHRIQNLPHGG